MHVRLSDRSSGFGPTRSQFRDLRATAMTYFFLFADLEDILNSETNMEYSLRVCKTRLVDFYTVQILRLIPGDIFLEEGSTPRGHPILFRSVAK